MSRYGHPADSAESRRRRTQAAADLRAAETWLAAEVAAMDAAERRARLDGAMTALVMTLCALLWVLIVVLVVGMFR